MVLLGMLERVMENKFLVQTVHGMLPLQTKNLDEVKRQEIPAYNIDKSLHPKSNDWLGYLIELDGKTYYVMGDTDAALEAGRVDADVVLFLMVENIQWMRLRRQNL